MNTWIFLSTLLVLSLPRNLEGSSNNSEERLLRLLFVTGRWQAGEKLRECSSDASPCRCWQEILVRCTFSVDAIVSDIMTRGRYSLELDFKKTGLTFVSGNFSFLTLTIPALCSDSYENNILNSTHSPPPKKGQFKRQKVFSDVLKLLFHLFFIEMIFKK